MHHDDSHGSLNHEAIAHVLKPNPSAYKIMRALWLSTRHSKRSPDYQITCPYLDTIRAILAILLVLLLLLYIYYTHALLTARVRPALTPRKSTKLFVSSTSSSTKTNKDVELFGVRDKLCDASTLPTGKVKSPPLNATQHFWRYFCRHQLEHFKTILLSTSAGL